MNGIYKIENLINHKVYIGQSKNIEARWKEGFDDSSLRKYNSHLRNSVKKYGMENFSKEVILETWDMDYWEKFFIQMYHSTDPKFGYNKTVGGQNTGYGFYNEEVREKIRQKATGRHVSDETKLKLSKLNSGKNNARYGIKGELHPSFGKKRTDKEKKRISEGVRKSWENKTAEELVEWKKHMSDNHADVSGENHPLFGIGHTEESKKKMSESHKVLWTDEKRKEASNRMKGKLAGGKNPKAKKVRCIETGEVFDCIEFALNKYPKAWHLSDVCNGLRKTAGSLHWEFVKE